MRMILLVCVAVCAMIAAPARASFHLMQIEQVIGGVNGDTSKQAIQLRMRSVGQGLIGTFSAQLRVFDATGANPITLIVFDENMAISQTGSRILIASQNFLESTEPECIADFTIVPMQNLIPASYMAAGSLTFGVGSTNYWRLSWGGASYTGPNTGAADNDANGNYGPPFAGPLPSTTLQALRFTPAATAPSTSNSLQYQVTTDAAVFTNNANQSFTVIAPPEPCRADFNGDGLVFPDDLSEFITCFFLQVQTPGFCALADFNGDGLVFPDDLSEYITTFFLAVAAGGCP